MNAQAMKDTARRWIIGIWDHADFDLFSELASPGYVFKVPGQEDIGSSGLREAVAGMHASFPDLNNSIEEQFADGDVVVTRGTTRGTHQGPFAGVPASGNSIAVPWVIVTRFSGGLVTEDWELYDAMALMTQTGAIPKAG